VTAVSEWIICKGCGLKHKAREPFCPRCERPHDEGQLVFSSHSAPVEAPTDQSALKYALPLGVLLGLAAAFVFIGPLGGRGVGLVSMALVLLGLGVLCVGWAWSMALALRVSTGSFVFALLVPYVSTLVMRKWQPLVTQVMGTVMVVLGVLFAPPGFTSKGRILEVAQACELKGAQDSAACACIGAKTVSLMTSEERSGPFDAEAPQTRELMTTAEVLCRKERLIAGCVAHHQGSQALCTCVIDAAVDAFTPTELENMIQRVNDGLPPDGYTALRNGCGKR
jgi:hypothetical protein